MCPSVVPDTRQGRLGRIWRLGGGGGPNQGSTGIRHDHDAVMTGVPWPDGLHPPLRWFEHATAPLWQCTRSSGEGAAKPGIERALPIRHNRHPEPATAKLAQLPPKASISFPTLTNRAAVDKNMPDVRVLSSASSQVANSHLQQHAAV